MTVLNDEQQRAFALMASGHNVAILRQAGTGKTMLVREGVKRLRERGKCVTVTASTGMAARQYKDATTVHHWAGLLDGRYDNKELLSRIRASEDQSIVERIKTADSLVIDEISMISSKTFEQNSDIAGLVSEMSSKIAVAAIDFGTTYSGYAFSLRSDFQKKPTAIQLHRWSFGNVSYNKVPTSILFDEFRNFHSFGFEAEQNYAKLAAAGTHKDWYLFRKFKMALYRNESLGESTTLKDTSGKTMQAIDVFAAGIAYLKNHLMKTFSMSIVFMEEGDIHWILTVPAIWDDSAKQFVRKSANKAGIVDEHLTLALEPEAAAVYCQHIPDLIPIPVGSPFMVLDCGGGTVDVTVHTITANGTLKELHKPTGGDWGGIKVDDAFYEFLLEVFGMAVVRSLTEQDKLELQGSLDELKRKVVPSGKLSYTITIPICLIEKFDNVSYLGRVKLVGDKLKIDAVLVKSFFDASVKSILSCVQKILDHSRLTDLRHVIMVGGYSDSDILKDGLQMRFPNLQIIRPVDAATAILKGSVIYGHRPQSIGWRVMKFTYGVSVCSKYDEEKHKDGVLRCFDGVLKCVGIFDKYIEVDEILQVGYKTHERYYTPTLLNQAECELSTFCTGSKNPQYVTDIGCKELGKITLSMADSIGQKDRHVRVNMILGDTELKVEAIDAQTGKLYNAAFDFMQH
ncbi:hypothetical protein ScPMuIL_003881 [Solemya velum]